MVFTNSLSAFEKIGGVPSNAFGSSYSEIYKSIEKLENLLEDGLSPNSCKAAREYNKLYRQCRAYLDKSHASEDKKKREREAVEYMFQWYETNKEPIKVTTLVEEMQKDNMPLIKNTGLGWEKTFIAGIPIIVKDSTAPGMDNTNGLYTANTLWVNKVLFWTGGGTGGENRKFAMSILVHEYHHLLTKRNPEIYYDEYAAHYKQYVVLDMWQQRKAGLNDWLLKAYKGPPNGILINGPEQIPDHTCWENHIDNL